MKPMEDIVDKKDLDIEVTGENFADCRKLAHQAAHTFFGDGEYSLEYHRAMVDEFHLDLNGNVKRITFTAYYVARG